MAKTKMTLQALYEQFIRLSLDDPSLFDGQDSPLAQLADKVSPETPFAEICVLSDLYGAHIPHEQNFVAWGENYLIQTLYFLVHRQHTATIKELFNVIRRYKCLQNIIGINFADVCFDAYFDAVMIDGDMATALADFIISKYQKHDRYGDFFIVANATGRFSTDSISYRDFLATKPKK